MTSPALKTHSESLLTKAASEACSRVAPTWPLDQSIAVNPWWEMTHEPIEKVATRLSALNDSRLLMPRSWYRSKWESGLISQSSLEQSCKVRGIEFNLSRLIKHLDKARGAQTMALMTHVIDAERDLEHHVAWTDEVVHQISQFCAAYYDQGQASWHFDSSPGLYSRWLSTVAHERGIGLIMGVSGMSTEFKRLPSSYEEVIEEAVLELDIPVDQLVNYFHALLLSVNGWASWCAYQRWQARLAGEEDDSVQQVLAIRLAWELVLFRSNTMSHLPQRWKAAVWQWSTLEAMCRDEQVYDWVWQEAHEIEYFKSIKGTIQQPPSRVVDTAPHVQAAFCIDVRSEVFRRSLESVSDKIQTIGFAGFFGMPIAYQPLGTDRKRPQLPGLFAPAMLAVEKETVDGASNRLKNDMTFKDVFRRMRTAGPASYSYIESFGMFYGWKLFKDSVLKPRHVREEEAVHSLELCQLTDTLDAVPLESRVKLAEGALRGLSLTSRFAPVVLLVGHGSESTNNPLASGLDCGACCGQTGAVNARLLAGILNNGDVRSGLRDIGIQVPDETVFVAALHNTTTDEMSLFDAGDVESFDPDRLAQVKGWLNEAGSIARKERASALNISIGNEHELALAMIDRSRDWAQVRPEWGLAGNAAFIIAPRSRSRGIDLKGRSFLHDYNWQEDNEFKVLELLMTAPMIVTHWINMQYNASTTDNEHYGSGNKVLHNVVGGKIGVFEGNGGDLRIGLARQSIHDGESWVHEPIRLHVLIAAPTHAIDGVIQGHDKVHDLVKNGWIKLFQWADDGVVQRWTSQGWEAA